MLVLYVSAALRCPGLPWPILAAIGKVETNHGRGALVSPAGALGPMQFMPATWAEYGIDADGDGDPSIWEAADAVPAAADLLCANGGGQAATLDGAIYQYNHADWYVQLVLAWAARYATAG
jgi:membrane-bound lytic murein transglycosylase B